MGKDVNRKFVCLLIKIFYLDKQKHHKLCHCYSCKRLNSLLSEMERWSFYELNRFHNKWFIIFHRKFCKMLQVVCEKSNDDLQISSEEAIMAVSNEVVVHESITIDE